MTHTFSLSWQILTLELRKVLSYRAEFFFRLFGRMLAQIGVSYFLWTSLFATGGTERIAGFTLDTMLLYYIFVPFIDSAVRGGEFTTTAQEIYDGSLSKFLLYPAPYFLFKFWGRMAETLFALGQLLIGPPLVALLLHVSLPASLSPASLGMALVSIFLASGLYFLMATAVELLAFWAENTWSLILILRWMVHLAGGVLIPLALFPEWSRMFLTVLPFPHLVSTPVRALMGDIGVREWLVSAGIAIAWIVVFGGVVATLWRHGRRAYAGTGI